MIREASIILPLISNAGESLKAAHASFQDALIAGFGGFTASAVFGAWKDVETQGVYHEESTEYRVAAEWTQSERAAFRAMAERVGAATGQLAVYLRDADGAVDFVNAAYVGAVQDDAPAPHDHKQQWKRTRAAERAFKYGLRDAA